VTFSLEGGTCSGRRLVGRFLGMLIAAS